MGDFGEDGAGDAEGGCAERFTDGEANEARPGVVSWNEKKNKEHHEQLDGDQHHTDAHACFERRVVNRVRLSAQAGENGARVRGGGDANPEPCDTLTATDAG